jgi:predicted transcriptional regulator
MTDKIDMVLDEIRSMNQRLAALEQGKNPAAAQKQPAAPKLKRHEKICVQIRKELETKELVRLSKYASGGIMRWVRDELKKDKSLRIIAQKNETYVIKENANKTTEPNSTSGSKQRPIIVTTDGKSRKKSFVRNMNIVKAKLDSGKILSTKKIARLLHITQSGANNYIDEISQLDGYELERKGAQGIKFLRRTESGKSVSGVEHQYMKRKSPYMEFMGKKIKFYGTQGMNQHDAFRAAITDWNGTKASPGRTPDAFPSFRSVKPELVSILSGVLRRLFVERVAITYKGVAYALDIQSQSDYTTLIEEIVGNQTALKRYFHVDDCELVWNGRDLSIRSAPERRCL